MKFTIHHQITMRESWIPGFFLLTRPKTVLSTALLAVCGRRGRGTRGEDPRVSRQGRTRL